jgi:amino acid permease
MFAALVPAQNIFAVCNEMQGISVQRVSTVITGAVGTGMGMYLVLASIGYATFGSHVDVDFLTNYPGECSWVSRCEVLVRLLHGYPFNDDCSPS